MEKNKKFSQLINTVCDKIMFKRVRTDIEDELYDHLMCQYDKNIACGMSEDEAMKEAERLMGNANELKYKLSAIHTYYPSLNAKKAISMLIFGYVAYVAGISLTGLNTTVHNYIFLIGSVLTLCAMYCLKTANKTLKAGFIISLLYFISCIVFASSESVYFTETKTLVLIKVISLILIIIQTILVAKGISILTKPYKNEYSKSMKFFANTALFITATTLLILIRFIIRQEFYFYGFICNIFVWLEFQFMEMLADASTLLYNADHEYNIQSSPVKKTAVIVCSLVLAFSSLAGASWYLNSKPATLAEPVINDVQLIDKEYQRITANLKSYNVAQDIIDNLPISEIEKFKDSVNFSDLTESAKKNVKAFDINKNELNPKTHKNKGFEYSSSFWPIGMRDNEGNCYFRAVLYIRYPNKLDQKYNDILVLNANRRNYRVPRNLEGEYNGDFLKFYDDSGKEYKPLAILKNNESTELKYSYAEHIDAVEFKAVENLNIYYAFTIEEYTFWEDEETDETYTVTDENGDVRYASIYSFDENGIYNDDIGEKFYHSLYHRRTPISILYSTGLQLLRNDRKKAFEYLSFYESENERPLVYSGIEYNYYLS